MEVRRHVRGGVFRWCWRGLGAALVLVGVVVLLTAQAARPQAVVGTIAAYAKYTRGSGTYVDNQLVLRGTFPTYTLHAPDFQPALPQKLYEDSPVTLWADANRGGTQVLAITLYDAHNAHPVTYTTDAFIHPDASLYRQEGEGWLLLVLGLLCLLASGPRLRRWMSRAARTPSRKSQPVTVGAGMPHKGKSTDA